MAGSAFAQHIEHVRQTHSPRSKFLVVGAWKPEAEIKSLVTVLRRGGSVSLTLQHLNGDRRDGGRHMDM